MTKKNIGGRPKKGLAEKLKYRVTFMLRTGDFYALKTKADAAGLTLAEFSRLAVTGCRIRPRITVEQAGWLRTLSGMAGNLNQLARQANRGGYGDLCAANIQLGREMMQIVRWLRDGGEDS